MRFVSVLAGPPKWVGHGREGTFENRSRSFSDKKYLENLAETQKNRVENARTTQTVVVASDF